MSGGVRQDYIAGLWRQSLLKDLLWTSQADLDVSRPDRATDIYVTPSWPWAALGLRISAPINCKSLVPDPTFETLEATVDPPNQFGPLKSGFIDLIARIHACTLNEISSVDIWGQTHKKTGPMLWNEASVIHLSVDEPAKANDKKVRCYFLVIGTFPSSTMPYTRENESAIGLLLLPEGEV